MLDVAEYARATALEGDYFDAREAARACEFFPRFLRHAKGRHAGQPFVLEPWQSAIIATVFGWRNAEGFRRFRQLYLEVPRKNGKTQLAAGINLFLLFADKEAAAEVWSVANNYDQASLCWTEAARMRSANEKLATKSRLFTGSRSRSLYVPSTYSRYSPMSSKGATKDGLNASGINYDEFHAFWDRLLYEVMHTSTGARTQPLETFTTTAGTDRNSLWWETRSHVIEVAAGNRVDHSLLPVVYGADLESDIHDPAVWARANPNLGVTISAEYLRREAAKAAQLPRYENAFKRLHLNIPTEQAVRWLPMPLWDAADPRRNDLIGRKCFGGLDLSSTTDVTSLALVFPDDAGGVDVWAHHWIPEETAEAREREDRVPYREWARLGLVTLTEGNAVDYDRVRAEITGQGGKPPENRAPIAEQFNIESIGLDRWNATQMATWLMQDGLEVVAFGQGYSSMSGPAKRLEQLVLARALRHGGDPVLRWMASNAAVETDAAENIKPIKDRKAGRIDGIVATVMGLGRWMAGDEVESIYNRLAREAAGQ